MIAEFDPPQFFFQPHLYFKGKISFIIVDLIEELKKRKAETEEGIFRVNGNFNETKQLCEELDKGKMKYFEEYEDIHIISSAFKKFFRTFNEVEPFLSGSLKNYDIIARKKNLMKLKRVISSFDKKNSLAYLMKFLKLISLNSAQNRMNYHNLAICWGMYFTNDNPLIMNDLIEMMINNYDQIFDFFEEEKEENYPSNREIYNLSFPPISIERIDILKQRNKERRKIRIIPILPHFQQSYDDFKLKRPTRSAPKTLTKEEILNLMQNYIII
jgi:hypothetical protein